MQNPTFVICDRCRAEGLAGEDPFEAFGALLDFEPVPRRSNRADGWDADVQRAYIAALSLTGSERAACRAVGKSAYGVTQLVQHEGSAGFRAAREEALAMAADERGRRLAEGVRAVASEQSGWRPADPPWSRAATRRPPAPTPSLSEEDNLKAGKEWLVRMIKLYLLKLRQEREARTAGRIAAADFYIRQATWMEVALDLMSGDAFRLLRDFRHGDHALMQIAETTVSSLLDAARRDHWQACGDPPRPGPIPEHLLVDHGGYSTEPGEATWGGLEQSHEEQTQVFEERHKQAAAEQIEWEAEARRDYEARSTASMTNGT